MLIEASPTSLKAAEDFSIPATRHLYQISPWIPEMQLRTVKTVKRPHRNIPGHNFRLLVIATGTFSKIPKNGLHDQTTVHSTFWKPWITICKQIGRIHHPLIFHLHCITSNRLKFSQCFEQWFLFESLRISPAITSLEATTREPIVVIQFLA